jgi:hypothetical protein
VLDERHAGAELAGGRGHFKADPAAADNEDIDRRSTFAWCCWIGTSRLWRTMSIWRSGLGNFPTAP